MVSILDKIKRLDGVKKFWRIVRKVHFVHFRASLCFNRETRTTYANYVFRRKQIDQSLALHHPLPRNLYIEGTNICNADCVFCPYSRMQRPKLTMSMELFKNVIDQYVAMGGRAVGFTPIVGDPLLDKYLLDRMDYLDSIDQIQHIGFYTNAIALSAHKTNRILEYSNTTINLNISFGGYDRETFKAIMGVDRFDQVKCNVLHLLDQIERKPNPRVIVKLDNRCPETTEDDPYYQRLSESVAKGLVRYDTRGGYFDSFGGYIKEEDIAPAGLQLVGPVPKIGPCEILYTKPLVLADGKVNACAERDLETTLIIGDITKEPLHDILAGAKRSAIIEAFYKGKLPQICRDCTVYQSIFHPHSKIEKENLNWSPR